MKASSSYKILDQEVCVEKHKAPTTRCDQQIWLDLDLPNLPQPEKEVLSLKQPGCRNLEHKKCKIRNRNMKNYYFPQTSR